jgi:CrcB protein
MQPEDTLGSTVDVHADPAAVVEPAEQRRRQLPRPPYSIELLIGSGAFAGVLLRFLLSSLARQYLSATFPIGTLLINLVGCFAIGVVQTMFLDLATVRREVQVFVVVGLIGGFTTFSSVSVETVRLIQGGLFGWALGYQALSLAGGMAAAVLGTRIAHMMHRSMRRRP